MKCSRCGSEMKIKNIKVDTDVLGNPIYRKYAYCSNCKAKHLLDQPTPPVRNSQKLAEKRRRKRKMRKLKVLLSLLLLVVLIAGACIFFFVKSREKKNQPADVIVTETRKNKIKPKDFAKLELGMTTKDVFYLIGNEGNKLMQTTSEETSSERYQWFSSDGDGDVLLLFRDDKLINISQSGMDDSDPVSLTADMTDKIKADMSYEDVTKVIGGDGALMSATLTDGITTELYAWTDDDANISVVFADGKVKSVTAGGFGK